MKKPLLHFVSALFFLPVLLHAQPLPHPILFCTQVPNPNGFGSSMETFGNHNASMDAVPRGGDLYIRYPDGTLKNLTQLAGYGQNGMQGATAIAVRDPHVHWDGQKALFSMVVGAPTQQYQVNTYHWQLYEVTGLGQNDTPVITLVPNQPAGYNNVNPIYGTDDRIIFASDRARGGYAHLYPQLDEYETSRIVSGLWRLDPKACNMADGLEMLTHSPSGDFSPIIDHAGRVVFTRWDHLQRDQQADADIMNNAGYGTFNYTSEAANATPFNIYPDIEVFPEPRSSRTDLLALPEWQGFNGQTFNIFNPWMMNEDGTELEMLNHLGRHEMGGNYFDANLYADPNLHYFYSSSAPTPNPIRSMFQMQESPITPGLFYGTEAGEFGSHASGMIVSVFAPPGTNAEQVLINHITHPETRTPDSNPPPEHTGLYRNPLPLSNGQVLVMHTSETDYDQNIGTSSMPKSSYDYRLRFLIPHTGVYLKADTLNNLTGAGISKTVSWWSPDQLRTYSGLLWETFPVEVRPTPRPVNPTNGVETVPTIEQSLFTAANVDLHDFKKFLRRNNISMLVTRDVTSRDDADEQQPFNLKVYDSAHQTVDVATPDSLYTVKYMRFVQADQLRGWGGQSNTHPGRRPIAQYLHDSLSTVYNLPTTGPMGSQNISPDGSVAAIVPANRALSWQLADSINRSIVHERLWLSTVPGEVRVCTSCHGESNLNQAGQPSPTNPPLALTDLLNHIKVFDRDNDGITDIYDAYPTDPSRHIAEPLSEEFLAGLVNWINENPNSDAVSWQAQSAVPCGGTSAAINNQAANVPGTFDRLRRFVDLDNLDDVKLSFKVAYARYDAVKFDRLRVHALTCDGGDEIIYDKSGSELATAPDQTALFTPADCNQWRTECVNLTAYAGKTVELVFENVSGWGNRLFLDSIRVQELDTGNPLPTFSGEENPCANDVQAYTLTSTHPPGTTYLWDVSGGTLQSGQGTTGISVQWGAGGEGSVSVRAGQACVATTTKAISIHAPPVINAPAVTQPGCLVPTGTIVQSASGSGLLEYSINNGASYQASPTFSGLAVGSYQLMARPQAAPSCTATFTGNPVLLSLPPNTLAVDGTPISSGTYRAEVLLHSAGMVANGGNVIFSAGQEVLLNPLFEVQLGGVLEVLLPGCY
ncbi:MAG: hypothetical protein KDD27_05905 [Saprospiraceae bacterium]|nr:hypothetical protein [Saprospiraceae bacterium]